MMNSPITPFKAWVDTAENLQKNGVFPETSFVNRVLIAITSHLWHLPRQEDFVTAAAYVQSSLDTLCIRERPEDFYYTPWHFDFVEHLLNDTPEELHIYMNWTAYAQLTERTAEKRLKTQQLRTQKEKVASLKEKVASLKETQASLREDKARMKETNAALRAETRQLRKEISALEKKLANSEAAARKLKNSRAYRLGTALLYIPRKLRALFQRH